jgi:hypothetical protein
MVVDNFLDLVKEGYQEDDACKTILDSHGTAILSLSEDGFIYKGKRLYIPCIDSLKKTLLAEYHDAQCSGGHRGIAATHHKLIQHYYWPHMYEDVVTYVKECHTCQQSKSVNQRPGGLLQPLELPEQPLTDISLDFITHLPKTINGNNGILVIVDRFSKYVRLIPTTSDDESGIPAAERTAELFFRQWCSIYGIPKSIVSDRDPQFTSNFWTYLFQLYTTTLKFSSSYHPETDGQTERTNRTLEEVLRAYVGEGQLDWDDHLWHAQVAINTARQESTGVSPHTLLFGRPMRLPVSLISDDSSDAPAVNEVVITQQERIEKVRQHLLKAQEKQKKYADKDRRDLSFNVGDYVWVSTRNMKAQGDNSEKLKSKYAGPYKILRKINQVSYELQLPEEQRAHGVHPVYHVSKLRKFIPRLESFADDNGNELPPPPALIDDEGYDQWEVEAVLNKKRVGNNVKYLIKWKGYSAYNNTWEPVEHLMNAREYIEEFEAAQAENKRIVDELHARQRAKGKHRGRIPTLRSTRTRGGLPTASAYIHPLNVLLQSLTIADIEE